MLPLPPFFVEVNPETLQVSKEDLPRAQKYIRNKLGRERLLHENKDVLLEPQDHQVSNGVVDGRPTYRTEKLSEILWDRNSKSKPYQS